MEMKRYKLVIFDLDGTLLDTSPGIIYCYNTVAKNRGVAERPKDRFRGIIGCPLGVGFERAFGFTGEEGATAVTEYRALYRTEGVCRAEVYPGIAELLAALQKNGMKTAVATLKLEQFAVKMMQDFGLAAHLDLIHGVDQGETRNKADLLKLCCEELGFQKEDAVLIGDSSFDAQGAREAGMDFIGVTYGWGFACEDDVKEGYYTAWAKDAERLQELLLPVE